MGTVKNKDTVRRVYEDVVNNHNLDVLGNYFAPDYVSHKTPGGLEGTRQLFVMLFEAFPDVRVSVDSLGARASAKCRSVWFGGHSGIACGAMAAGA
jgi:hypothetical protein